MNYKEYDFDLTEVNAVVRDGDYIWIAFSGGTIKKVSAYNLNQTFYSLTPEVDDVLDLNINGNYLYALVDDDDYIGIRYSTSNPLTSYTNIDKPAGITQTPKKSTHNGTSKWHILLPGEISGKNAKLLIFDNITYSDSVEFSGINNAKSLVTDGNDNIWIVTHENPAKLIKVFLGSGDIWSFNSYEIA